jgi:hypothetical protein
VSIDFSTLDREHHEFVKIPQPFQTFGTDNIFYRLKSMACKYAYFLTNVKDALETQGKSLLRNNLPTDLSTDLGDTFSLACYGKSE